MPHTLLIIGAGIEACEGLKTARSMGLHLIVADGDAKAPGLKFADHRLIVSTYDGEALARAALQLRSDGIPIDGVIAMCADVPLSAAKVAQALGLRGLSEQSALWVADKLLMKDRLAAQGVPIPKYRPVFSPNEAADCAAEVGLPFIIKPVDSRGARGVQLVESTDQFFAAYEIAKAESPTGRVMVEEYLQGPQFSTETLIENGHCHTLGFSDRNYEWLERTKPFLIENGGDAPTALGIGDKQRVIETAEAAAGALAIHQGVAKGDMVLTDDGPKVIEIAGRLSGGYFSTTQIPLATNVNFVAQAIRLALDQPLDFDPLTVANHGVAIRYLDLRPGEIASVTGIATAESCDGVEMLKVFLVPGSVIPPLSNHTQRAGFVITKAKTKQRAIEHAEHALAQIEVTYASS
jgi:biotin carboxylase